MTSPLSPHALDDEELAALREAGAGRVLSLAQIAEEQRRRCRAPNPTPPLCSAGRCARCGAQLTDDGRCPTVSP